MLIASCAKVSSPTGGPKDEEPPVVISSEPENGSVNFDRRSFEITFDEYFILDNIDQVLMISPPLNKKPKILDRGKSLKVELDEEEELIEDMTYSFNFLNSIKDLNENNPIENFKYVFSTGDVIDSLSVTGHIYNAFNLEAGEEIFVILHSGMSDTLPEKSLPAYITRASENGKFRIDNIASGEYKIYGLKDDNNNKRYDLPTEAFAFLDSSIYITSENNYIPVMPDSLVQVSDSTVIMPEQDTTMLEEVINEKEDSFDSLKYERIPGKEYELYYFITDNKNQYLSGTDRSEPYLLQFVFSLPVDTSSLRMQFAETEKEVQYIREFSAKNDTVKIWLTDSAFYSRERITLYLVHPETDSLGQLQQVSDTLNFMYRDVSRGRGPRAAMVKNKLPLRTNLSQSAGLRPGEQPAFVFDSPVIDPDTSLIKLFIRSDTVQIRQQYHIHRDSSNSKKFILKTTLVPDSNYVFVAEKGAFNNIYGHYNDSIVYNFKVRNPDQFGQLIMNITGFKGKIIVQLMDTKEDIVREKKISLPDESMIEFPYLDNKEYLVKVIFDIDGNGEWTTGDYDIGLSPEPVTYFDKKIEVKKGWEMIEDWQLTGIWGKNESISTTRGAKKKK